MSDPLFNEGALDITPSKTSSHRDFDFCIGSWQIHNRKLKSRLKNCTEWLEFPATCDAIPILNGCGTFDQFRATVDGESFEGATLRLFNPKTGLWSIYWAATKSMTLELPVVGSFDGPIGRFFSRELWEGTPIICQFQWDKTNPEAPIWSQAFSTDNGETWEWNWVMSFRRRE